MTSGTPGSLIPTSGALPWRLRSGRLQVAVIHRPRYDDWSWPKGKLDPGEDWPVAAVREVWEETGLRVRLGAPLPTSDFPLLGPRGQTRKQVRYWAADVTGGSGRLFHEVDAVRWVEPAAARKLLSYERDHAQLEALVTAHQTNTLAVRAFAVVRHAKALPRRKWTGDDWLRPLDEEGRAQARKLPDLLLAFGVVRLLSSSATRCVETFKPYSQVTGVQLATTYAMSEESFERRPEAAVKAMERHLHHKRPSAICSHGPVLPVLLSALAGHARRANKAALAAAAKDGLDKGEALIAYLDRKDRVTAVERFPPLREP
ncbi:MAG: NUDIX hydrolase [Micrococcales bacterium]|nr:NUDIX hydrolase [Micrococcales bacterium]